MNSMTMAAHQVEEYVEPGYFPGQVPITTFTPSVSISVELGEAAQVEHFYELREPLATAMLAALDC